MTYQIAFDIGVHHFAWSVLQIKDNSYNVISISSHDFLKGQNANQYSFDQHFWKIFHKRTNSKKNYGKIHTLI